MASSDRIRLVDCGCFVQDQGNRLYLPLVKLDAHTTILSSTTRTTLTQTFSNPHKDKAIEELRYIFPLYQGAAISSFACTVGERLLHGEVKERQHAKKDYQEAVNESRSAVLIEQSLDAADVFITSVGRVPPGTDVRIEIAYLTELEYDTEFDGLRLTIPTSVAPRYGDESTLQGNNASLQKSQGLSIKVDVHLPQQCTIRSIQSPSHTVSVNIGALTEDDKQNEPSFAKANVMLSHGSADLGKDFVLLVATSNFGTPAAFAETHPTIPNQRALMAALVPKFETTQNKPEVVFVCDRSGSMCEGRRIPDLITALGIFLRSLPVGVKFNICSFGSEYEFLFERSQTYSQETLDKAIAYAETFDSDLGGTEMKAPFEACFERRYNDMNLEIFLLTDGYIWDQNELFDLINSQVRDGQGNVRVFSLGIGNDVSHALVEGIARAGRGFSQSVTDGEKMDKKVIRMLKASLTPHMADCSLEIKYDAPDKSEDDYIFVERVEEALKLDSPEPTGDDESARKASSIVNPDAKSAISLFQVDYNDGGSKPPAKGDDATTKYDHLPPVSAPRYLQAPNDIVDFFPFGSANMYVLLSDQAPGHTIKSIVLRGKSDHGALELEIPVENLDGKSTTMHQLAARKAIQELEEGRGWIYKATDAKTGKLLKDEHDGKFQDMVEREAVRIGVQFQVASKWCSYVATDERGQESPVPEVREKPQVGMAYSAMAPRIRLGATLETACVAPAPQGDSRCYAYQSVSPTESEDIDNRTFRQRGTAARPYSTESASPSEKATPSEEATPLYRLTSLQMFSGYWEWIHSLEEVVGITRDQAEKAIGAEVSGEQLATVVAISFFETRLETDKEVWEMIVDKAKGWLENEVGGDKAKELLRQGVALFHN